LLLRIIEFDWNCYLLAKQVTVVLAENIGWSKAGLSCVSVFQLLMNHFMARASEKKAISVTNRRVLVNVEMNNFHTANIVMWIFMFAPTKPCHRLVQPKKSLWVLSLLRPKSLVVRFPSGIDRKLKSDTFNE
jgi:hypothetical protein